MTVTMMLKNKAYHPRTKAKLKKILVEHNAEYKPIIEENCTIGYKLRKQLSKEALECISRLRNASDIVIAKAVKPLKKQDARILLN